MTAFNAFWISLLLGLAVWRVYVWVAAFIKKRNTALEKERLAEKEKWAKIHKEIRQKEKDRIATLIRERGADDVYRPGSVIGAKGGASFSYLDQSTHTYVRPHSTNMHSETDFAQTQASRARYFRKIIDDEENDAYDGETPNR